MLKHVKMKTLGIEGVSSFAVVETHCKSACGDACKQDSSCWKVNYHVLISPHTHTLHSDCGVLLLLFDTLAKSLVGEIRSYRLWSSLSVYI